MEISKDEYSTLLKTMREELKYYVPYEGQVLSTTDSTNTGMLQCSVPYLGRLTQDQAIWCKSEFPAGIYRVPKVGAWVKIYFMGGDRNRPYWGPLIAGFQNNNPQNMKSNQINALYEDANNTFYIKHDTQGNTVTVEGDNCTVKVTAKEIDLANGTVTIKLVNDEISLDNGSVNVKLKGSEVDLNGNSKTLVTYSELNQAMQTLAGILAAGTDTYGKVIFPGLTIDISASQTTTIKTGG